MSPKAKRQLFEELGVEVVSQIAEARAATNRPQATKSMEIALGATVKMLRLLDTDQAA